MTQKELTRKLIDLLSTKMSIFNFKPQTKEQGFVRKEESATFFYYFLIYNRTNIKTGARGYQIEPYCDISISGIEKYYKEININKELKSEWDFITLGNSIANLLANPDGINRKRNQSLDLYVFEERHIKLIADELLKQFNKVAMPYFLANNSISKVDELLNKHPKEYCVHMNNDLFRFIKGIIAAKLNDNSNVDQLLQIYDHLIIEREMPKDCKEEMERLKSILPIVGNKIKI